MEPKSELRQMIERDSVTELWNPTPPGGQQVGMPRGMKVELESYGIVIILKHGRSQHQTRRIAYDMIEYAIVSGYY